MVKCDGRRGTNSPHQRTRQRLISDPVFLTEAETTFKKVKALEQSHEVLQRQNKELKHHNDALHLAACSFSNSDEGIVITDSSLHILNVNAAFCSITGYAEADVIGQQPGMLIQGGLAAKQAADIQAACQQAGYWKGEVQCLRKDGTNFAAKIYANAIFEADKKQSHVINYIGFISDVSQLKLHEEEMIRIANYDVLTGLPNRRLLIESLNLAMHRAQRTEKLLAVCFLDIDGFKLINDSLGHQTGDQVLVEMAERLRFALRMNDIIARQGGDEFVLLLTDLSDKPECWQILKRVLDIVRQPFKVATNEINLTVSIGVTIYPEDLGDKDILLQHADQAMYQAKSEGKNRCQYFKLIDSKNTDNGITLEKR